MTASALEIKIQALAAASEGRPADAYRFVYQVVIAAVGSLPVARHVTALEVLEHFKLAVDRDFGDWGSAVLSEWRLTSPREVGAVVFELVNVGVLRTDENDAIGDFDVPGVVLYRRINRSSSVEEAALWKGEVID